MNKRANALILVLVVMIIVSLGAAAILQAMISYSQLRVVSSRNMTAFYLAEAGMQYAVWQLASGEITSPVTITTEKYPIVIKKTQDPDGSYTINSEVQYPDK